MKDFDNLAYSAERHYKDKMMEDIIRTQVIKGRPDLYSDICTILEFYCKKKNVHYC